MPQFIDTSNLPATMTRAERQYVEFLQAQNEKDDLRHYLIIECQNEKREWQPALFFEPTHEVVQSIISELSPLWTHAHQPAYCQCARQYHRLLTAYRDVEAANISFTLTKSAIDAFCKQSGLKAAAKNAARYLEGQVFFSQQDAANAVYAALSEFLDDEEVQRFGGVLVEQVQAGGINPAMQQTRLKDLQTALAPYKAVVQSAQAAMDECPLCHLPHQASFVELLLADKGLLDRFFALLVGGKVRPKHLPAMLQALELWLFNSSAAEEEYQKKMFPNGSVTGTILKTMKDLLTAVKAEMISRLSYGDASMPTISSSTDSPPPMPPQNLPPAN